MKTKNLKSRSALLLLFPVAAVLLLSVSCSSAEDPLPMEKSSALPSESLPYTIMDYDTTWVLVDKMPEYEGGVRAILKYVADNVNYPETARKNGVQGRVIVRFRITADGSVDNVSVERGVSPELDSESVKVIQSLPAFTQPAFKDGKPVAVWYMVPISFQLR